MKYDDTSDISLYQRYLSELDKLELLRPHCEQVALMARWRATQDQSAYADLWEQSLRLVLYVFDKLKKSRSLPTLDRDDMDAIQEANLAAGIALQRWEPEKGTLASWLVPTIRGTLLNYSRTAGNGGIGSRYNSMMQVDIDSEVGAEELSEAQDEPGMSVTETFTLADTLEQDDTAFTAALHSEVEEAVDRLPIALRLPAGLYFIHDISIIDISEATGLSHMTVRRMLLKSERILRSMMK